MRSSERRDQLLAALQPAVAQYREQSGAPDVLVSITDANGTLLRLSESAATVAVSRRDLVDALFEIGSISKSIVAVATLRSVRAGLVSLAQPVATWLPVFRSPELARVTLHDLLTHTAGLPIGSVAAPWSEWDVQVIRQVPRFDDALGRFYYSNLGYNALGDVLECAHGVPLARILEREVFEPLSMRAARGAITHADRDAVIEGHAACDAEPLHWLGDALLPAVWEESLGAAGCVISNAEDLCKFLRALLRQGEGVLTDAEHALMFGAHSVSEAGDHYGYGLFTSLALHPQRFFHGGGMIGHRCLMMGDRASGLGVTVMTNMGGSQRGSLLLKIGHELLDRTAEVLARRTIVPRAPVSFEPPDLLPFVGRFFCASDARRVAEFAFVDGELRHAVGDANHPVQWTETHRCMSRCEGWSDFEMQFGQEIDGRFAVLMHGSRRFDRSPQIDRVNMVVTPAETQVPRLLAGRYRSRNPWGSLIQIVEEDGRVHIHIGHISAALVPLGENLFRIENTPETVRFDSPWEGWMLRVELTGSAYFRCKDELRLRLSGCRSTCK